MHLELLPSLLVLLIFARLLGKAFNAFGQHEIIGEIVAGLLLGPVVLNIVQGTSELSGIIQLSVFLLIFGAGLEMDLHEILDALKKKAFLSAAFGFFLPLASGVGLGVHFDLGLIQSLCIGLCLAITALPIVLKMLSSFEMQDTSIGHTVIGAAIIIDIIALLLLGVIIDTPTDAGAYVMMASVGKTCISLIFFFALILKTILICILVSFFFPRPPDSRLIVVGHVRIALGHPGHKVLPEVHGQVLVQAGGCVPCKYFIHVITVLGFMYGL
jgi:Kef-type K+ transport system membrane component KefB